MKKIFLGGLLLVGMLSASVSAQDVWERIGINDNQRYQIQQILQNAGNPQTDAERQAVAAQVFSVLTPQQQAQLQQMAQNGEFQNKKRNKKRKRNRSGWQNNGAGPDGGYYPGFPNGASYPAQQSNQSSGLSNVLGTVLQTGILQSVLGNILSRGGFGF